MGHQDDYRDPIGEVVGLITSARICRDVLLRTVSGASAGFTGDFAGVRSVAAETRSVAMTQALDFTDPVDRLPRLLDGGRKFPDYMAHADGGEMLELMGSVEYAAPNAEVLELNGGTTSEFTPGISPDAARSLFDGFDSVMDGISEVHNGPKWARSDSDDRQNSELAALIATLG